VNIRWQHAVWLLARAQHIHPGSTLAPDHDAGDPVLLHVSHFTSVSLPGSTQHTLQQQTCRSTPHPPTHQHHTHTPTPRWPPHQHQVCLPRHKDILHSVLRLHHTHEDGPRPRQRRIPQRPPCMCRRHRRAAQVTTIVGLCYGAGYVRWAAIGAVCLCCCYSS
jgi:hypothetical protein